MDEFLETSCTMGPFWSRNRLTFLQNARYQGVLGTALHPGIGQMDSYLSDQTSSGSLTDAPALIVGSSSNALSRALATVSACGMRVAGQIQMDEAAERIERQVSASAIWIELERQLTSQGEQLLDQVAQGAAEGRYAVVVSGTSDLIDPLAAKIDDPAIELVIDGDEVERAAALALSLGRLKRPLRLSDVASDKNAARLRQLSEEVSRIASTLARLSAGPGETTVLKMQPSTDAEVPPVAAETVRSVIRARRLRARYFPEHLFADPAWDMLLDLLQAEIAQLRVPVSSLCIAAAVPATTALRWLKTMVEEGLFIRRSDPHDGRRVFVELAPETSNALHRYFAEVGRVAPI